MICPNCKGDGRQNNGGTWGRCDLCNGIGRIEFLGAKVPTLEIVMGSGYTEEAARSIVAREQARADRGEKPYGPNDPTPDPWATPVAATKENGAPVADFEVGQLVRLKSGGPDMTVTALLGEEVACEWTTIKQVKNKEVAAKDSGTFNALSLQPLEA